MGRLGTDRYRTVSGLTNNDVRVKNLIAGRRRKPAIGKVTVNVARRVVQLRKFAERTLDIRPREMLLVRHTYPLR